MKTILPKLLLAIAALVITLTACTKEPETSPDPDRAAFLGKWNAAPTKLTYEVTISEDPNSTNGVLISNFALIGLSYPPAGAEIKGTSIILDSNQVIGDGLKVKGSGVLSGDKITWNYSTFDGADFTQVAEIYTRK
jgi:hypothetical protein